MKRKFFSSAVAMVLAVSVSFAANDPIINEEAKATFRKEFAGAESVRWIEAGEYIKASFVYQGCSTEAWFSHEGELKGTVRAVFFSQLPLAVVTSVNKKFEKPDVLDTYEISNDNGTSYRITLVSGKNKYKVLVDASGNISDKTKLK